MAVISGGTTLIDNGTLDAAVPTGKMTLLSTQTASASATISFTSGIDSTYDSYVLSFIIFTQLPILQDLLFKEILEQTHHITKLLPAHFLLHNKKKMELVVL